LSLKSFIKTIAAAHPDMLLLAALQQLF